MEEKGKTIKKGLWLSIIIAQSILILGIAIWAITQKVEAEKQKVLALQNINQGELKYQKIALESKDELEELKKLMVSEKNKTISTVEEIETLKKLSEASKIEAVKYRDLYEKCQKRKK